MPQTPPAPQQQPKRALVIDAHYGCVLCHRALLRQLGYEVETAYLGEFGKDSPEMQSRSLAARLFAKGMRRLCVSPRTFRLDAIEKNRRLIRLFAALPPFRQWLARFDVLLCAFPPALFQVLLPIAARSSRRRRRQTIVLNMAHRFHIHLPPRRASFARLEKMLAGLMRDKTHIVGSMADYDRRYAAHYLSQPARETGVSMFHIPLSAKTAPQEETILIAPVNRHGDMDGMPFKNSEELNALCRRWRERQGIQSPLVFRTVREACGGSCSPEDLHRFAGAAVFPYSAYSVSEMELYECGIPFFYPALHFLLAHGGMLADYRLHPRYLSRREYGGIFADLQSPDSPNSEDPAARRKWLAHFSGYRRENAILFSSLHDLFAQAHGARARFAAISSAMCEENRRRRAETLARWRRLLE